MSFKYRNKDYDIVDTKGDNKSGFAERGFLEKLRSIVREDAVIVDAGGNIGNHSIYFSEVMKAKRIYTFEPIPLCYNTLTRNISKNCESGKVEIINKALAAKMGILRNISMAEEFQGSYWLWYKGDKAAHPSDMGYKSHNKDDSTLYDGDILSITLDSVINEPVDFIKIDVEGMEFEVLKGAIRTITKSKPIIQVEVCVKCNAKVPRWLASKGYMRIEDKLFKHHNQLWVKR